MRITIFLATAIVASLPHAAIAAELPASSPLIVDGAIRVEAGDIEGYMLRIPEARRAEVRATHERVATMADNLFVARSVAAKARQAGLDKDPSVQRRLTQIQEAFLADLYLEHLEKTAPALDLEPRARELYAANPAKYVLPEQVRVQHLMVGMNGRTREMAQERARQVYEQAKAGKEDFLALAARYSDHPEMKRNGGELGYGSPTSFSAPLAERIARMTKEGEISEPIETPMGFHIVRFMGRKKTEQIPYEEVKRGLIAAEKERMSKARHEELLREIRSSRTVTVYRENVDALVTPSQSAMPQAAAADTKPAR